MIYSLLTNIKFWSALFGLAGALLIFFFGLPPKIDPKGHIHLILEQEDKKEKEQAKKYKGISYIGILLLVFCFLLQLISIIGGFYSSIP